MLNSAEGVQPAEIARYCDDEERFFDCVAGRPKRQGDKHVSGHFAQNDTRDECRGDDGETVAVGNRAGETPALQNAGACLCARRAYP